MSKFSKLSSIPQGQAAKTDLMATASSSRKLLGAMVVAIDLVVQNSQQVRQIFNEESLQELADDIKARGILEPLIVRENADGNYEIIAGERRFRAAKMAGLAELPVIVRKMDDKEARFAMLVENLQRENLDPNDEQRFFQQLIAEYNLTQDEIARLVNKSRGYVRNRLDGGLQGMQPIEKRLDSEKDNKMASQAKNENSDEHPASEKSNKMASRAKKPSFDNAFKRFSAVLDTTLSSIKEQPTDTATVTQLKERVGEMRQKLAELEKELNQLAKPNKDKA